LSCSAQQSQDNELNQSLLLLLMYGPHDLLLRSTSFNKYAEKQGSILVDSVFVLLVKSACRGFSNSGCAPLNVDDDTCFVFFWADIVHSGCSIKIVWLRENFLLLQSKGSDNFCA